MIRPRYLVAGALAALTVGPVSDCSVAQAQAPNCGGNSTEHPTPIDCINSKTIGGITGTVRLVVDDNGYVMVTATVQDLTPNTPLPPLFLQVKAHVGISSNPGFVGATDVFDGNTASVELQMPACEGQIDVKIAPGQPTLDHIPPVFRVAAPLVGYDCTPDTVPTTVPETVPTTAPTSAPATSSPQSSPTTLASGGSTTAAPTASSVVGATLPATGNPMDVIGGIIAGLLVTFLGVCLIVGVRGRPAS